MNNDVLMENCEMSNNYFTIDEIITTEEEEKELEELDKFLGVKAVFPLFINPYEEKLEGIHKVKNYIALCEVLGEEVKTSTTSKNIQLKKWKEYFDWEKDGQAFKNIKIISEEEHGNKLQQRLQEKKGVYLLYSCVTDYFERTGNSSLIISPRELALCFGFINSNFKNFWYKQNELGIALENKTIKQRGSNDIPKLKEYKKELKNYIDENIDNKRKPTLFIRQEINDFYLHTTSAYKNRIKTIIKTISEDERFCISTQRFIGIKNNGVYKEKALTLTENEIYINDRYKALKNLGCTKLSDIYKMGIEDKFNEELGCLINKDLGALYVYETYVITYSSEFIKNNKKAVLSEIKNMNITFSEQIFNNKNKRVAKTIEEYNFINGLQEKKEDEKGINTNLNIKNRGKKAILQKPEEEIIMLETELMCKMLLSISISDIEDIQKNIYDKSCERVKVIKNSQR